MKECVFVTNSFVVVFSKNQCHKCRATVKKFVAAGITPYVINIDEEQLDPEVQYVVNALYDGVNPREYVLDRAGEMGQSSMPYVEVFRPDVDKVSWFDFRDENIKSVIQDMTEE